MKKRLAILLSITMVFVFAFAACGGGSSEDLSDSKYVGTWEMKSMSLGDEAEDFGEGYTLVLNGDGTGTFTGVNDDGEEEVSDITWSLSDDGFKTKGDSKMTFTDDGDGIKTKILGVELHFVKAGEGGDAADAGEQLDDPVNGAAYGYAGDDPVQAAVYQYLVEEVAKNYDLPEGAVSIPVVQLVDEEVDSDDGDAEVKGYFAVYNYVVEGDTLKMVSGGDHPGKMELIQAGSGYTVKEFEPVADGGEFEPSAKDIFEEKYDTFMSVYSDTEAKESLRAQIMADYVKANGLAVTKYQDEGWDPVDIPL